MKTEQSSKNEDEDEYETYYTNACPVCYARFHDTTRRRPQQLYDHLMSKSHTKADLADYLQMEEMINDVTGQLIAQD